jgi:uncharacterized OsmC-like protein
MLAVDESGVPPSVKQEDRGMTGVADIRRYEAHTKSSDVFGRVLCNVREHHFMIDGPVANGCPGEEVTPAEMFLASVASCGIELVQVIAKQQDLPVPEVRASIRGIQDRSNPARQDYSVFNRVELEFRLRGVSEEQGHALVDAFKRR